MARVVLKEINKDDICVGDYIVLKDSLELRQIVYVSGVGHGTLDVEDGMIYGPLYNSIDKVLEDYDIHRVIKCDDIEIREI